MVTSKKNPLSSNVYGDVKKNSLCSNVYGDAKKNPEGTDISSVDISYYFFKY